MQGRGQRAVCSARENEQPPNAVITRIKFKTVCFAWQTIVRMACWFMCDFSLSSGQISYVSSHSRRTIRFDIVSCFLTQSISCVGLSPGGELLWHGIVGLLDSSNCDTSPKLGCRLTVCQWRNLERRRRKRSCLLRLLPKAPLLFSFKPERPRCLASAQVDVKVTCSQRGRQTLAQGRSR